jgi:hypothetical protein
MKDLRGIHAAAVRNGIFKEFGLQVVGNRQKNVTSDISEWKKSKKVKDCFKKLYDDNYNAIENIAKHAFPSVSTDDESFDDIYVYTAAVCDIVLNPDYPDLECSKKPLERRFRKFKVFFKHIEIYLSIV